ncbi:MAG: methylated-DNA--[protein]-cysteine S-methyltransferase [Oscillospiraceae bacterium]|nr:methylated-DNA--[protein]-cysteine S-methyltransferase [Oscillospiraceae bacterium]
MLYYEIYPTGIGKILIGENGSAITDLCMEDTLDLTGATRGETPLLKKAADCLRAYLAGGQDAFADLPLDPQGTDFQKKVWAALLDIPYGQTISYKELAVAVGNPAASRAVGSANGKNPIFVIIPCHRVIGANGALTGFAYGLDLKKKLLAIEGARLQI